MFQMIFQMFFVSWRGSRPHTKEYKLWVEEKAFHNDLKGWLTGMVKKSFVLLLCFQLVVLGKKRLVY